MKIPAQYSNYRFRDLVEEYCHSERDRKILVRKYCDKRTIFQLAEEFELSETRIKNILYTEGMKIFSMMEKN